MHHIQPAYCYSLNHRWTKGSSGVFYNIYIQEIQVKVVAMFMWWTGSLAEIRGGKWAAHKPQHVTWYEKRTTWWQVTVAFCPHTWNSFTTFTANTSTPQTRRTWNHTFAFGRQQQKCWVSAVFMWQTKKKEREGLDMSHKWCIFAVVNYTIIRTLKSEHIFNMLDFIKL